MITHHIHYAPFTAAAIEARTPYVRGHEIRWTDPYRSKYGSAMAEYLDLLDGEDESTGSTEWSIFARRFGKRILCGDDRGFVWVTRFATEDDAIREFEDIDAKYCAWENQDEDEDEDATPPAPWCEMHERPHAMGDLACELYAEERMTATREECGTTFSVLPVLQVAAVDQDGWAHDLWTVTVTCEDRQHTFPYRMGTGHGGAAPTLGMVMESLFCEYTAAEESSDVADYAESFGWDWTGAESLRDLLTDWEAIKAHRDVLVVLFGDALDDAMAVDWSTVEGDTFTI